MTPDQEERPFDPDRAPKDAVKCWLKTALGTYFDDEPSLWAFAPLELEIGGQDDLAHGLGDVYVALSAPAKSRWRGAVADLLAEQGHDPRCREATELLIDLAVLMPAFEALEVLPGVVAHADAEEEAWLYDGVVSAAVELSRQTEAARVCLERIRTSPGFSPAYAGLVFIALCRAAPGHWPEHVKNMRPALRALVASLEPGSDAPRWYAERFLHTVSLARLARGLSELVQQGEPARDWLWDQLFKGESALIEHSEAGELESIFGELEELVVERVLETWRSCFDAATSTGFSLLRFGLEEEAPARSPPPITFATIQAASDFFSEVLYAGHGERYREAMERLWNEDDTGYLFYLAFGALFAAEGKWRIAHMLATRALALVETGEHRERPGKITGREAYYLRAMAQRLTARARADFDEAEDDLRRARVALERSRASDPAPPIGGLRFDAEQAALDLSRHLFDLFAEGASSQDPPPERLDPLQDRIHVLLGRVDGELPHGGVRERVRRALLVNYLTCLILRARPRPAISVAWRSARGIGASSIACAGV